MHDSGSAAADLLQNQWRHCNAAKGKCEMSANSLPPIAPVYGDAVQDIRRAIIKFA
jgi:hypothetical protein